MTAAEFRAIRAGLGVSADWLGEHLQVAMRTVQRWESGATPVAAFAAEGLLLLEVQAADQVSAYVEAFEHPGPLPPLIRVPDGSDDAEWPPGWVRMIAFRVRQQVPALMISDELRPDPTDQA